MIEFKNGIWYFAHPYTCKDANGNYVSGGEEANFRLCNIRAAKLIEKGYVIYSPISHTHPIHVSYPPFVGQKIHEMWYKFVNENIRQIPFKGIISALQPLDFSQFGAKIMPLKGICLIFSLSNLYHISWIFCPTKGG